MRRMREGGAAEKAEQRLPLVGLNDLRKTPHFISL